MNDPLHLDAVIDRVAELLYRRIGLRPDRSLRGRLHRAVRDEASRHGVEPTSYVDRLAADGEALQGLMNRVTVQETGFFRHPEQFEALARDVLPDLPRPVRLWSAACANGQEAYSLAMVLEEQGIEGEVLATDLSTAALQRTEAARYFPREMSGLSSERVAHFFVRVGEHWEVTPSVRNRVSILRHNLLDPLPRQVRSCRVVFCRNVLIYLSPEQVKVLLDRIADDLDPSTTFVVGAAETIWQYSDRFRAVHVGDTFVYRRRAAGDAPPVVERTPQREVARPRRTGRADPAPRAAAEARRAERVRLGTLEPSPESPGAALELAGQEAVAVGDYATAVVAFRKCAYLRPHDPLAQLHLGLALEASGDTLSAGRAFAAARRALLDAAPDQSPAGLEGYAAGELLRLLESKR